MRQALILVGLALWLVCAAGHGQVGYPGRRPVPQRLEVAERALKEAEVSGDFSRIKAELRPIFLDENLAVRMDGLMWIESHKGDLTQEQRFELYNFFVSLRPSDDDSHSLLVSMAREKFMGWPLASREEAYREAIATGSKLVEEHFQLTKTLAIKLGALDGLAEFAPLVEANAAEIDASEAPFPDHRFSAYLLWKLRLEGGGTEADGGELAAVRVEKIAPEEFNGLMERDGAFRHAVGEALKRDCAVGTSPACRRFARVAMAQRDLRVAKVQAESAGKAQGWQPRAPSPWLSQLWRYTGSARSLEAKSVEEASRGDPLMDDGVGSEY